MRRAALAGVVVAAAAVTGFCAGIVFAILSDDRLHHRYPPIR